MAPPKAAVLSQQQQQQQQQQQGDLQLKQQQATAKPRKRRAKQSQQSVQIQSSLVEQPKQQPKLHQVSKSVDYPASDVQESSNACKVVSIVSNEQQQKQLASVVPSERTTLKKQQLNQVPSSPVKEISVLGSKQVVASPKPTKTITPPVSVIDKHHQISTEEADDVDAGIELDGSSNSGSSVKDMNEDQMKSTSVSPIMAQSNHPNESGANLNVKQVTIAEVAPEEQLTKTMCSDAASPIKKTTKQQLAANQQVIDADEQQLQEKLQNKQRKSTSFQDANSNSLSKENNSQNGDRKPSISQPNITDKSSSRLRRSFSSQSSQEDATLCKVCEQHVYQMERMLAEKSVYHKRCFRCHQCKIQLRVDNYSSHEGQVYCKAHHRQIFQPQVKLDKEDDVDIVAKSTIPTVDDYLLHRGRLSELSFSFLNPKPEGILKRQMIICENEPAELPKDVVRSDTKIDDGIDQLNLNLNNILEKFERGTANNGEEDQPSSAGVVIEKPSFNIKQTLMAFESKLVNSNSSSSESSRGDAKNFDMVTEKPVVKKLTNKNLFLNRQNSRDNDQSLAPVKPLVVRRSESLMMRLKKYESRIAGEFVDEDSSDGDEGNVNNKDVNSTADLSQQLDGDEGAAAGVDYKTTRRRAQRPDKLTSIDLSSLKNQWENGDILKRRNEEEENEANRNSDTGDISSPSAEKNEELSRIRQQLAQKKLGESGPIRNIYENAIKDAKLQQKQQASRRDSSDLSALNGFSTNNIIQKQLLHSSLNGNSNGQDIKTSTTPNKDHFQLNLNKKANKLKEKFELGLITNSSRDDSDISDSEEAPELTKLEQIRQEKLEDLSIFTDGQIKSREARNLFQQIDRRISAANGGSSQPKVVNSRSLASIGTSMRSKLNNQMNTSKDTSSATTNHNHYSQQQESELEKQQPIRLTNNVRI